MREAFEKWLGSFKLSGHALDKNHDGEYRSDRTGDQWEAWKAAWNTSAQASAPEVGLPATISFKDAPEDTERMLGPDAYARGFNFCREAMLAARDKAYENGYDIGYAHGKISNAKAGEVWKPIETAPKDGTLVILTVQCDDDPVIASWISGSWIANSSFIELRGDASIHSIIPQFDIIGWMPIPDPMWRIWGRTADSTHDKTKA